MNDLEANPEVRDEGEKRNWNDNISVRITPAGEAVWNKYQRDKVEKFRKLVGNEVDPMPLEREEDGSTILQLRTFMDVYGSSIDNQNKDRVVENMEFRFVD